MHFGLPAIVTTLTCLWGCVDTSTPGTLSPLQHCEAVAAQECERIWTCLAMPDREAQRASWLAKGKDVGQDQTTCAQNLKPKCALAPTKCEEGLTFQDMKAWQCIENQAALSCSQWLANEPAPVPCDKVCTVTVLR